MTQKDFETKLRIAVEKAKIIVQNTAPVRTGKLKMNVKLTSTPQGYKIYVDTNAVDYMVYTEEPWISPRWGGRENPNLGWFKESVDLLFRILKIELGGTGQDITQLLGGVESV